jgi:hypothetical protein
MFAVWMIPLVDDYQQQQHKSYLLQIITTNNRMDHTSCASLPATAAWIVPLVYHYQHQQHESYLFVYHYQQQQHGSYLLYIITSTCSMNHTPLCIITSNNRIDHTSCGSLPAATEWIIPLVDHYRQQQNGSLPASAAWIIPVVYHYQHEHESYFLCITEQQQNGSYLIALLPATAA